MPRQRAHVHAAILRQSLAPIRSPGTNQRGRWRRSGMTLPGGPRGQARQPLRAVVDGLGVASACFTATRRQSASAEFVVTVGSRRSSTRRNAATGAGSGVSLRSAPPMSGCFRRSAMRWRGTDGVRFVFVSGSEARELAELCESARDAESVEEFERIFLAAQERKQSFERLLRYWTCDVPTAIERLRRIEVRTIGERDLEDKVRWGAQALFPGDPGKVLSKLRVIVEDSVHRTITRRDLVEELSPARLSDAAPVQPQTCGRRGARSNGTVSGCRTAAAHPAKTRPENGSGNVAVPAGGGCDRQRRDRQGRLREDGLRRRSHGRPCANAACRY